MNLNNYGTINNFDKWIHQRKKLQGNYGIKLELNM